MPSVRQRSAAQSFFSDEGIGSGLDDAAVDVLGAEDAAETRRRFVKRIFDCAGVAVLFQSESGGESGDAAADYGDASHECGLRASAFGLRVAGFVAECS